MTKKNWIIFGIMVSMMILVIVMTYVYMVPSKSEKKRIQISVVVYGSSNGRWTAFKEGVDQAETDFEAVVNFIIMDEKNDFSEQAEVLKRELEGGAQGLAVAAADCREMKDDITELAENVPVILVESDMEVDLPCVAADAYQMGSGLARQIVTEMGEDLQVYILPVDQRRSCTGIRLQGFLDEMKDSVKDVTQLTRFDENAQQEFWNKAESAVLVALDDRELEHAVTAVQESEQKVSLYGIGSSEKIVYELDRGVIKGIVFQNEFNMGYEAVEVLIQKIRGEKVSKMPEVDYHHASKETMHLKENERLLFPIIQ
ncbi:MAG: substrate-binding domain-containing protein [Lachnospiraceae bacterium]|nr:substrate-binding domain-containing protein [Lachnospiraceae bacterium]